MNKHPKISFIGAGSTVFVKNILGDILSVDALKHCDIALMDIDPERLSESEIVITKIMTSISSLGKLSCHLNQKEALIDADFVIVAFQIGGFDPCTITDFEICNKYGVQQTIADTLGPGGVMRGMRTIPYLWSICEDVLEVCPDATILNYVNPMAINTRAIYEKYPQIKQVGLCHSVQGTAQELANDLEINYQDIKYLAAGINHMTFYLKLEYKNENNEYIDAYPKLLEKYDNKEAPKLNKHNPRCQNIVRYEAFKKLGYFVTESSEHFAEYTPYFIKHSRPDLIEKYQIPLNEYPKRCMEQIENWKEELAHYKNKNTIKIKRSNEYASTIINAIWTDEPSVIYGNVRNTNLISNLPENCCVEVPCLIDRNGIQPTYIGSLPTQLAALIQSNVSVQTLAVEAIIEQNKDKVYYSIMMDPHTAATLDLDEIWQLVDDLIASHGDWLPHWLKK